jgi:hypothetical protein
VLRGDFKARQDGLAIQRQWGIISANEWREREYMNPIDEDWADEQILQTSYTSAEKAMVTAAGDTEGGDKPDPEEPTEEITEDPKGFDFWEEVRSDLRAAQMINLKTLAGR